MTEPARPSQLQQYLRLLSYLKPFKFQFAFSIVGFMVFAASQPMLAKFFELVITAIESKDAEARLLLPLGAIGIFFVRGLGSFVGNYYNDFVGISIVKTLKASVFEHLTVVPSEYYDENNQGKVLHQLNNAAGMVHKSVTDALKKFFQEGLTVIFLLGYAFYLNWKLSLVFLFLAPVLGITVSYASKRFRRISRKNEENLSEQMQVAKEMISNYLVVRVFGAQGYEISRYMKALNKAFKNQLKIRKTAAIFTPLTQLIVAAAVAGIVYLLLSPENLSNYSTAELIGYLTAIALLPRPFRQLSGINITIQRGLVGAEIVFRMLDTEPERDDGELEVEAVQGDLKVSNLTFRYPGSSVDVLKGLSFFVKKGETVALVGESGSGKSTLASLLTRSYQVPNNSIFLDDIDINDYRLRNLRKHISVVDQNTYLFNDSIKNNIAYGDGVYSDEDIDEAMRLSHSVGFVHAQENGLDAYVGDNGQSLSGGQRQRLAIARAFLKKAPILILDEATSALDNESESVIKKAAEELSHERTTIIIAHRLSTIESADRLLVMRNGEVVEEGTHSQLLEKGGYYARLNRAEYSDTVDG